MSRTKKIGKLILVLMICILFFINAVYASTTITVQENETIKLATGSADNPDYSIGRKR